MPLASYDVAIVGLGPIGLACARLLAAKGVRVAAVDPNRIVCQHPRATHLDDETMRSLQTLGVADLGGSFLCQDGWELLDPDGVAFLRLEMPEVESDQAWRTDYQFHQPDCESRLRGLLASDENVEMYLGWDVVAVEQSDERATLELAERKSGDTGSVEAAYVVGSDGAGSFMRPLVADHVEDIHGTQRSLIIDVYPFDDAPGLPRTSGFVRCEGRNPITYVPIFPPMRRFEFMLQDGDDAHEFERPGTVYRLLDRWLVAGNYRIMRSDVYEWHAYLVHGWRNGRLLLAGDAAHEMPPMLGQGMCSGMRDAFNLSWKVAAVVSGLCEPSLLDTYESERAPHVRPYIEESARQSNMVESFGSAEGRPPLGEPQILERLRPLLGPGLVEESVDPVGQLAPQPRLENGALMDDVVGYNFAVIGDPAVVAAVDDNVRDVWRQIGTTVMTEHSAGLESWLAEHSATAAIVRPDRYTFALAADAAELAQATMALRERIGFVGAPR